MELINRVKSYFAASLEAQRLTLDCMGVSIVHAAEHLVDRLRQGNKILVFSNGGLRRQGANMKQNWIWRVPVAAWLALSLSSCAGLLVGGAAVGVGVAHDRRTTGAVVDDQTIELKLYDALNQQLPPGNHINATSYNGAVLLSGEAVSELARQQAETIARGIDPPIREVYNELVIGPPSALSSRSNDLLLTTKVKAAFFQINIPDFDPTRVKVVTERGVVYLIGLVRPNEADAVANIASQVSGARQVVTLFEYIR